MTNTLLRVIEPDLRAGSVAAARDNLTELARLVNEYDLAEVRLTMQFLNARLAVQEGRLEDAVQLASQCHEKLMAINHFLANEVNAFLNGLEHETGGESDE